MGKGVAQITNEDPERLRRVLDAKWRTIGVDKDALSQQVVERNDRERSDKERDEAFARLARYYDDQLSIQQQEADRIRKQVAVDMEAYRQDSQLKHTRKEWDLNRPDRTLLEAPARVGDDDPRLGASSLQVFQGEDLSAGDRKAAQMEQARGWWEQQTAHKAALQATQKQVEEAYGQLLNYQDALQQHNKATEASMRREIATATSQANQAMAEQKRIKALADKAAELAANLAEIDAMVTSPMLTEDPNTAASALSTLRVRKDHYKGMSDAEKKAILATQLAQMEEKKARLAAQAAEESSYARTQADILRAMNVQASRVEDFKRQQLGKAADVLRAQRVEKAARDKALGELYANQVAPQFFEQFGTSHR